MTRSPSPAIVAFGLLCTFGLPAGVAAQQAPAKPSPAPPPPITNELDAFMEKVLKRREVNRQTLEQYVLDESEQFEVLGPTRMPVYRQKREYTWYVRDGLHVRSPVRFDGVAVGDEARKEYEETWTRRERERLERKDAKAADKEKGGAETPEPPTSDDPAAPSGATPIPTPRFVSEAYFMDFKFEPGNYYLAGREQLEGIRFCASSTTRTACSTIAKKTRTTTRTRLAPKLSEKAKVIASEIVREIASGIASNTTASVNRERELERQMNKTALVTLWVDPAEHQIVKYTFDNVWMDFLPAGWLVKVDDIRASMTMGQPFPGIWLPREMNIHAGVTMAMGSLEAAYARRFSDYKQADVKTLIRIPKAPKPPPPSRGATSTGARIRAVRSRARC